MAMKIPEFLVITQAFWEESYDCDWPQDTPGEHLRRKLKMYELCEDVFLLDYLANATQ